MKSQHLFSTIFEK